MITVPCSRQDCRQLLSKQWQEAAPDRGWSMLAHRGLTAPAGDNVLGANDHLAHHPGAALDEVLRSKRWDDGRARLTGTGSICHTRRRARARCDHRA
jgi:hypothetical protein